MNQVRALQAALVVVIVAASVFGGYANYRLNKLNKSVAVFGSNVSSAANAEEAKVAIKQFLSEANTSSMANSASAKKWWCLWLCGGGGKSSGSGGFDGFVEGDGPMKSTPSLTPAPYGDELEQPW